MWGPLYTSVWGPKNLLSVERWNGWDHPTSLYTRAWIPRDLQKFEWINNLCGILHGMKWYCSMAMILLTQNWKTMMFQKLWTRIIYIKLLCETAFLNMMVVNYHSIKGSVLYVFTLHWGPYWNSISIFHGTAFGWVSRGPHNVMVTDLGHSAKWPLGMVLNM